MNVEFTKQSAAKLSKRQAGGKQQREGKNYHIHIRAVKRLGRASIYLSICIC
jgi:hypothetical protein